jgi:2-amino-4-hydroxy-6-hydroxymethyldihydropteridine diphosphokinase
VVVRRGWCGLTESSTTYLSGGSNLGDRKANLQYAIEDLRTAGMIVRRISSVYETEPVGFLDQPWFLNIALEVETSLAPQELLACCLEIEARQGRVRSFPGAPRTLDLDILLFGNLILDLPSLQIPHPRMAQRRFILHPLAQIAPDVLHPVLGLKIASLLSACLDPSSVKRHSELQD